MKNLSILVLTIVVLILSILYRSERKRNSGSINAIPDGDASKNEFLIASKTKTSTQLIGRTTPSIYEKIVSPDSDFYDDINIRNKLPYKTISFDCTSGLGGQEAYRFTMHNTGQAELNAKGNMSMLGQFSGRISTQSYARLCFALDRFEFDKMDANYMANWNHDSTRTIVVETANRTFGVAEYGRVGPIELWAIQEILQGLRSQIEWIPEPKKDP